jgi:hypothetical protein
VDDVETKVVVTIGHEDEEPEDEEPKVISRVTRRAVTMFDLTVDHELYAQNRHDRRAAMHRLQEPALVLPFRLTRTLPLLK